MLYGLLNNRRCVILKNNLREKFIIKLNKLPKAAVIAIGFLIIMLAGVAEVLLNKVSKYVGPVAFVIIAFIGFWVIISPNEYKRIMSKEETNKKTAVKVSKINTANNTTVKKTNKKKNKQNKRKKKKRR